VICQSFAVLVRVVEMPEALAESVAETKEGICYEA